MLKCASVHTYEIDDAKMAFDNIRSQLEEKITLLANTVGIIMCHPDFIGSGALKYVCENLPFDLVGVTTSSQAVNDEAGEFILTVFVMTSDDIIFKTGVTGELTECIETPVKEAYEKVSADVSGSPGLALIFPPIVLEYSGDAYVYAWQKVIPNTPIFGTLSVDDTATFDTNEAIYNGKSYKNAIPFVLCYGNINPRFIIGTFPEGNVMPFKGEVTKSDGAYVHEVNNMNAYKYFETIGFASHGIINANYLFVPFIIDQKKRADYDGIPVVRVIASFTEEGSAIFHGDVDEGSTFTILKCEFDDLITTTQQTVKQINNLSDVNGVLLFPCIVRRVLAMRVNSLMELETVKETIKPDIPFMMGYAGGEICPTLIKDGVPTNRYHNYSLVVLVI